jgi:hypothetical protein
MNLGTYMLAMTPATVDFTTVLSASMASLKFICKNKTQKITLEFVSEKLVFPFLLLRRYALRTVFKVLDFGFIFKNKYLEKPNISFEDFFGR